jgi:hypothetical protein
MLHTGRHFFYCAPEPNTYQPRRRREETARDYFFSLASSPWLDPFHPLIYSTGYLGLANYMLKQGRQCAGAGNTHRDSPTSSGPISGLRLPVRSRTLEGGEGEAAEVLRINPGFTIGSWERVVVFKARKEADRMFGGLRKAGLPES